MVFDMALSIRSSPLRFGTLLSLAAFGSALGCADRAIEVAVRANETGTGTDGEDEEPCHDGMLRTCPDDPDLLQACIDGSFGNCPCFDPDEHCTPGDEVPACPEILPSATDVCIVDGCYPEWLKDPCLTPLVLVPEGRTVAFLPASPGAVPLDVPGCAQPDWPTADTPWLALDRDGDGFVRPPAELFGTGTPTPRGPAADGFGALAPLDADGNGRIDAADPAWSRLLLWRDADGDRVGIPGELRPLSASGATAIPLAFRRVPRCDGRGNCAVERVAAEGARAEIVDVHLACP